MVDDEPTATAIGPFRLGDESARYRLSPFTPALDAVHRISEFEATQPDKQLYPEFTSLLQESIVAET